MRRHLTFFLSPLRPQCDSILRSIFPPPNFPCIGAVELILYGFASAPRPPALFKFSRVSQPCFEPPFPAVRGSCPVAAIRPLRCVPYFFEHGLFSTLVDAIGPPRFLPGLSPTRGGLLLPFTHNFPGGSRLDGLFLLSLHYFSPAAAPTRYVVFDPPRSSTDAFFL